MLEIVGKIRAGKTPVYQMIRDIVCDSRFTALWRMTCSGKLRNDSHSPFIDSLSSEDWENEERRTGKRKIS